ncbi:MAG: 3D domain-containing protein [Turicibacter sp.]|nr:3D domain-containing protein [Turicibacter sp.]
MTKHWRIIIVGIFLIPMLVLIFTRYNRQPTQTPVIATNTPLIQMTTAEQPHTNGLDLAHTDNLHEYGLGLAYDLFSRVEYLLNRMDILNQEMAEIYSRLAWQPLGYFELTFYCPCEICTGRWSGLNRTASGTIPTAGRTIAVDTSVIPFGTEVLINGHIYIAEDTGSAVRGNVIDIFVDSHEYAVQRGRESGVAVYMRGLH